MYGSKYWGEEPRLEEVGQQQGGGGAERTLFDVSSTGNVTHADGHFLAVRSTQWGKYAWKQMYLCEENNGALLYAATVSASHGGPTRPAEVVDCLNEVLRKFHSKITRHVLPPLLFPSHTEFFEQQLPYLHGVIPIVVQDDAPMDLLAGLDLSQPSTGADAPLGGGNEDWNLPEGGESQSGKAVISAQINYAARVHTYKAAQIDRWRQWNLLAIGAPPAVTDSGASFAELLSTHASSSTSRPFTHPCVHLEPAVQDVNTPPVSKAAWDAHHASIAAGGIGDPSLLLFQFKIRILTFDRPRSLARLLDSLTSIEFAPEDRITLEISVDYPSDMTDEESVHNWRLTHTICDAFTWRHGTYSVIHQQQNIGLTGQWTWGWNAPDFAHNEIVLFMEDDMTLVPSSWTWMKQVVGKYYLNPYQYDPAMYGFSLQSQHTILGTSTSLLRKFIPLIRLWLNRISSALR